MIEGSPALAGRKKINSRQFPVGLSGETSGCGTKILEGPLAE
jgi:hypothetical protein